MQIRLMGLPDEVREGLDLLAEVYDIVSVRGPYQNRERGRSFGLPDKTVRAYVDARARGGSVRADAVRTDRPELAVDEPKQIGYSPDRRRR